ncbi:MAG TPA: hypothetical protein VFU47_04480, partial [Armatimonadota bacterium]|nr:hypothetical protein [Armatimonadota bacterium]
MQKLDRLGWTAGITFTSYGLRIGVRVNDPGVLPDITAALPPDWKPAAGGPVDRLYSFRVARESRLRSYNLVFAGPVRLARTFDLREALAHLEGDLQLYVAERARRRVFLHAGVVAWKGQALVFPGMSYAGKSTLTAALVRAGATYYSDEYAVLDAEGRVHPYARPLLIRDGEGGVRRVPAAELGGDTGAKPLPIGLIALCRYEEGARWRPRRLPRSQAILSLLVNTVPARHQPRRVLPVLHHLARSTDVVKTRRGEAEEVLRFLLADA